jgi:hypothetical protein
MLRVGFVAPANGGSVITGYSASCTSSDGGVSGTQTGTTSPVVVSALTNGKLYTCTIHATNAVGSGSQSGASAAMRPGVAPWNNTAPTITGSTVNHSTLTAHNGSWGGAPAPTFTRQWQRCNLQKTACVNVAGQTGATYTLHNVDLNHTIRVVVKATNSIGTSSKSSAATAKVHN